MATDKTDSRNSLDVMKTVDDARDPFQDIYVQNATNDIYEDGSIDPVYQAKAHVLNAAIQEIGMGRYQVSRPIVGMNALDMIPAVVSVHRRRLRVVCVRFAFWSPCIPANYVLQ